VLNRPCRPHLKDRLLLRDGRLNLQAYVLSPLVWIAQLCWFLHMPRKVQALAFGVAAWIFHSAPLSLTEVVKNVPEYTLVGS
jgi:hypothetical protein